MTFEEFKQLASDRLTAALPGLQLEFKTVTKLQGQTYSGLLLRRKASPIAASLDLKGFYDRLGQVSSPLQILDELEEAARLSLANIPEIDADAVTDYEQMKERLCLQLVPIASNEEQLKELPYRELLDLAIVYRLAYPATDGSAGILITQSLLQHYGITEEVLYADALASAPRLFPAVLRNMTEVLGSFPGPKPREEGDIPLWVASVEGGFRGAAVIAYPGFLEEAAALVGGDYYLLPSSVHEFLLLPARSAMPARELQQLIHNVNETEVRPEDRLSDSLYLYRSAAQELCLVLPEF